MSVQPDSDVSSVGCLALLWPAVDACLISQPARRQMERVAAGIAPLGRIALELRLGLETGEIDLHQFITGDEADAAILKRYLSRTAASPVGGAPMRAFLEAWACNSGGVRDDLEHLFLEWDRPDLSPDDRAPAMFLPVQRRHERNIAGLRRRERVADHVDRLGLGGGALAQKIRQILGSVPADLSISYIGFMLGRSADAVRINLRVIRPDDLRSVLEGFDWPGDHAAWQPYFSPLVARADSVTVALDFAPDVQPTIGFEAALDGMPSLEPRWPQLIDYLTMEGLCGAEKGAALKKVSARLYPEQRGQMWPASWLATAVMAPANCVPWFQRRLSHVKVSVSGQGRASAKAYLSAQHFWSRGGQESPPMAASLSGRGDANALEHAARHAVGFLLAARSQDDLWRDFRLVNGMSDEWVSGFVGFALAGGASNQRRAIVEKTAAALLRRQRANGGWGYNAVSPADADSTAWVLKMLKRVSDHGSAIPHGTSFLRSHLLPAGGFATYAPETRISFENVLPAIDDTGWRSDHACVAANAASLIPDDLLGHMRSEQTPEGNWSSYWWRTDSFATALAVQALGGPEGMLHRRRAIDWARNRLVDDRNSAFDRAWLIRILHAGGPTERDQARRLCVVLAEEQGIDGSWTAGAEMLFPSPCAHVRSEGDNVILDHRAIFTTASVLMAIEEIGGLEQRS